MRCGYRKITVFLKREGYAVDRKLVYRLYREEGLTLHPRSLQRRKAVVTRREANRYGAESYPENPASAENLTLCQW